MSFHTGRDGGLNIADNSSTLRNISAYLTNVGFPQSADTIEVATFGSSGNAKQYVIGLKDSTLSLEGIWDPTVDNYLNGILGATVSKTWHYFPNTTDKTQTDFIKYSGKGYLTSYELDTPVDGMVGFSGEIQVTGAVTRTTTT